MLKIIGNYYLRSTYILMQLPPRSTKLMEAASLGDIQTIRKFAREQANQRNTQGMTALMYASLNGHTSAVKILVNFEDPNIRDRRGNCAFQLASMKGWPEICQILGPLTQFEPEMIQQLKQDEEIQQQQIEKMDTWFDQMKKLELPSLHNQNSSRANQQISQVRKVSLDEWFEAARKNDLQTLKNGQYFKSIDHSGITALMMAGAAGNLEAVKYLGEHEGAVQTAKGFSALMFSVIKKSPQTLLQILAKYEHGLRNHQNLTALHIAIYENNFEAVQVLKHLPDENVLQDDGTSCLMLAVQNAKTNTLLVQEFISQVGMMRTVDHETALMQINQVESGALQMQIIKLLQQEINLKNIGNDKCIDLYLKKAKVFDINSFFSLLANEQQNQGKYIERLIRSTNIPFTIQMLEILEQKKLVTNQTALLINKFRISLLQAPQIINQFYNVLFDYIDDPKQLFVDAIKVYNYEILNFLLSTIYGYDYRYKDFQYVVIDGQRCMIQIKKSNSIIVVGEEIEYQYKSQVKQQLFQQQCERRTLLEEFW